MRRLVASGRFSATGNDLRQLLADRRAAAEALADPPEQVIEQLLREIVRAYPEGGPGHERAIRLGITRGWRARHSAGART